MFSRNSNFFLPLEIFGPDLSPVDVVDVVVVDVDDDVVDDDVVDDDVVDDDVVDDVVDDDVGQEFLRIKSQFLKADSSQALMKIKMKTKSNNWPKIQYLN